MSIIGKQATPHNRLFNATIDIKQGKGKQIYIIDEKDKFLIREANKKIRAKCDS